MHDIEGLLYGLAFSCPLRKNKEDCPMSELRKLPLKDRINKILALGNSERKRLYCSHQKCLFSQEEYLFNTVKDKIKKEYQ